MPSLEFFVVAQNVSVDQRTNRLSVFDILDVVQPKSFPAVIPRLVALSVWVMSDDDQKKDFQVALKITGPGLEETVVRQNFTADGPRLRTMQTLIGLPLEGQGITVFEVALNGKKCATHQIGVGPADANVPDDGYLVYPDQQQDKGLTGDDLSGTVSKMLPSAQGAQDIADGAEYKR
jgi:hypothetical protein